jgi:polysaccharide biosynthesis/export protein
MLSMNNSIRLQVMILLVGTLLLSSCSSGTAYITQEQFSDDDLEGSVMANGGPMQIDFPDASTSSTAPEFRLGAYDTIRLRLYGMDDYSGEIKIRSDGIAFFPFVGELEVEGMSIAQLRRQLEVSYGTFLKTPQVDVEVTDVESQRFFLIGQVNRPGMYALDRPISVIVALSRGMGTSENGDLTNSYLIRQGRVYDLNLSSLLGYGDFTTNVMLENEDIIYVPDKRRSVIYVIGKVKTPKVLVLDRPMTVFDAIAACGGFALGALDYEVKLIRGSMKTPIVYNVNMEAIMDDGRYDQLTAFMLAPGDIVFVPNTALASWNEILQQINPTLKSFIYDPLAGYVNYLAVDRILNDR